MTSRNGREPGRAVASRASALCLGQPPRVGGLRLGDADEAVHDAPHGAEQADEGRGGADGGEHAGAWLMLAAAGGSQAFGPGDALLDAFLLPCSPADGRSSSQASSVSRALKLCLARACSAAWLSVRPASGQAARAAGDGGRRAVPGLGDPRSRIDANFQADHHAFHHAVGVLVHARGDRSCSTSSSAGTSACSACTAASSCSASTPAIPFCCRNALAGGLDLLGAGLFTQGVGLALRASACGCCRCGRQRLRWCRPARWPRWRLAPGRWRSLLGKRAERQQQAEQQNGRGKRREGRGGAVEFMLAGPEIRKSDEGSGALRANRRVLLQVILVCEETMLTFGPPCSRCKRSPLSKVEPFRTPRPL